MIWNPLCCFCGSPALFGQATNPSCWPMRPLAMWGTLSVVCAQCNDLAVQPNQGFIVYTICMAKQ